MDQSHCGAYITNTSFTDAFADTTIVLAVALEVLLMDPQALHEESKPLRLQVSSAKPKVQIYRDLMDETVETDHACG